MGNGLVRVRMRRAVSDFVQVLRLDPGEVYELTPTHADQFFVNGMAEPAEAGAAADLETAALGRGRRRG